MKRHPLCFSDTFKNILTKLCVQLTMFLLSLVFLFIIKLQFPENKSIKKVTTVSHEYCCELKSYQVGHISIRRINTLSVRLHITLVGEILLHLENPSKLTHFRLYFISNNRTHHFTQRSLKIVGNLFYWIFFLLIFFFHKYRGLFSHRGSKSFTLLILFKGFRALASD